MDDVVFRITEDVIDECLIESLEAIEKPQEKKDKSCE